jgi:tRNA (guanine26-N2/guanine27-N2)-dimethyltransferase
MLAATGARGLRLLNETKSFREMLLTENDPAAFDVLGWNARPFTERGARVLRADARRPTERSGFDYVDLDPFGTPAPFVVAALEALQVPGIWAVTATDMTVLAGVQRGAAERRYGGRPIRGRLGPEAGLRLLLAYLDRSAATHGREIRPLLAYVLGHHVRAYLEVVPRTGDPTSPRIGTIDPEIWTGPRPPGHGPFGPLWLGPLFDPELVRRLRTPDTAERPREITTLLQRFQEESAVDVPFYYEPNEIAKASHLVRPPSLSRLIDRLRQQGFLAARTHARPGGLRTTASRAEVEAAARDLVGG